MRKQRKSRLRPQFGTYTTNQTCPCNDHVWKRSRRRVRRTPKDPLKTPLKTVLRGAHSLYGLAYHKSTCDYKRREERGRKKGGREKKEEGRKGGRKGRREKRKHCIGGCWVPSQLQNEHAHRQNEHAHRHAGTTGSARGGEGSFVFAPLRWCVPAPARPPWVTAGGN